MRTEDHPAGVSMTAGDGLADRFTAALAARDAAALRSLFGAEVDFRGLTPGRVWEAATPEALVRDVILGAWFEPADVIEQVEMAQNCPIEDRVRLSYRLRIRNPGGTFRCEQQAYAGLTGGKITWLRVLCSGFLPIG